MQQNVDRQYVGEVPPPVEWLPDGSIRLIDQTLLPTRLEYFECHSVADLGHAIRTLKVRGAPAIGVAAAYGLAMVAAHSRATDPTSLLAELQSASDTLRATRPTAVNLAWALDTVLSTARAAHGDLRAIQQTVFAAARRIDEENCDANSRMGEYGAALIHDGMNILTHCNTGPLAACGVGSALGVIYTAHKQGKRVHVWVDETRPLLQGARLTTWELGQWGIQHTLITDNMAASLMAAGKVDAVIAGADRIAANGDVANKIGTYGVAVLARYHGIPFYSAAPISTFDFSIRSGEEIVIEQRKPEEVTGFGGVRTAPEGVNVYNPAFDVTPATLVSGIITERGVIRPPYTESIPVLRHSAADYNKEAISLEGGA